MSKIEISSSDDDGDGGGGGGFSADEAMSFIDSFMDKMQQEPMLRKFVAQQTGMEMDEITEDMNQDTEDALKQLEAEQIQGIVEGIAGYVGEDMTLGELSEFIDENPKQVDTALDML